MATTKERRRVGVVRRQTAIGEEMLVPWIDEQLRAGRSRHEILRGGRGRRR